MRNNTKKSRTLAARLFSLIALLTVAVTLLTTLLGGRIAQRQILADQGRYLAGTAARIGDLIDQSIAERGLDILALSRNLAFQRAADQGAVVAAELQELRRTYPQFAWIGVTSADGVVMQATDNLLQGVDVSGRPWFARSRQRPHVGDLHEAKLLADALQAGRPNPLRFVDICAPIYNSAGEFAGVLAAHLYAEWINELIHAFQRRNPHTRALQVVVLNSNRDVIFGGDSPRAEALRTAIPQVDDDVRNGFITHLESKVASGYTGYARVEGIQDFSGLGWIVLVHQPAAQLLQPVTSMRRSMALTGTIIGISFLIVGLLFARSASRPIRLLSSEVADAEHIRDLANLSGTRGYAEVMELATTLRGLANRVLEGERELRIHRSLRELQEATIRDLKETANTDALTGVLNRRAFDTLLAAALQKASTESPVSVAVFDLDHFKSINDRFGHAEGDRVLQIVARQVNASVRTSDSFARIGGEEFALIYTRTSVEDAAVLVERLRIQLMESLITMHNGELRVTASFGLASTADPATGASTLLKQADTAMYQAKTAGRNCLRIAPS